MASKQWLCAAIVPLLGWTAQANVQDQPKPTPQPSPPQVSKEALKENVPFCHRASEIAGTDIKNRSKEDLGEVQDLVIDPETGDIRYAVISFGGVMGLGDKLFAVPFDLLEAPEVKEGDDLAFFTLDIDKSRLEPLRASIGASGRTSTSRPGARRSTSSTATWRGRPATCRPRNRCARSTRAPRRACAALRS